MGERPRVFVRDATKAKAMLGEGVESVVGDLSDRVALGAAMDGVKSVFLVTSGPGIPELDAMAAEAAKSAGVRHLVKLSSLDVEQILTIGGWHEKGEAAVRESGVPFTFVRPSGFMNNLLAWAYSIRSEGVLRSSTGGGRRPFIHSEDIAAVVLRGLTTGEFLGESIPLSGPEMLTFEEITAKISSALGRPLRYEAISDEEAGRRFATSGASAEEVSAHVKLWQAIREGRLATLADGVQKVLGREPIGIDQWIEENLAAFRVGVEEAVTN